MLVYLSAILSQTCSSSFTFPKKKVHPFWDLLICSVWDFNKRKYAKFYTPPKFNMVSLKMMVSKRNFLFWQTSFQVKDVKFWGSNDPWNVMSIQHLLRLLTITSETPLWWISSRTGQSSDKAGRLGDRRFLSVGKVWNDFCRSLNQGWFQGPILGPLYGRFPIIFPYHSHKNP